MRSPMGVPLRVRSAGRRDRAAQAPDAQLANAAASPPDPELWDAWCRFSARLRVFPESGSIMTCFDGILPGETNPSARFTSIDNLLSAYVWSKITVSGGISMPHPLVLQLRFARSEFQRALVGLEHEEARRRLPPMNCISWNIGHLAWQEQRYWLGRGQGAMPLPQINVLYASGAPPSAPPLNDIWAAWHTITQAADPWLDAVTTENCKNR